MQGGIEDLDELVLKCRDHKARDYIREAVGSYRAGSYRSSIVATWIAVCFDFISKLRELALAGDKEAEKQVQELDEITRISDVQRALKFEKEIIELAFRMEMISPLERDDLKRLQEDRNRCAHPSLNSDGERYSPPAELARLHINLAVNHLLMHEPAQGKFALERLCAQIRSQYFPASPDDALKVLQNGPLRRARPSLPRNLSIILLKEIFSPSDDYMHGSRSAYALNAIHAMHHVQYTEAMKEHLSTQIGKLDDAKLRKALWAISTLKDAWSNLDYTQQDRMTRYVRSIPESELDELDTALRFAPLREAAIARVKLITLKELDKNFFFWMNEAIMSRLITIFLSSISFEAANQAAKMITTYKSDLEPYHIRRILREASRSTQIMGSFELESLINALRETKKVTTEEFEELLESHGLSKFSDSAY